MRSRAFSSTALARNAVFAVGLGLLAERGVCGLEWKPTPGGRFAELGVAASGNPGFTEMSPASTGIDFTNRLSDERGLTNGVFMSGSGVAAGDIDGDGPCDLFFAAAGFTNAP